MSKWLRLQTARLKQVERTAAFLCLLGQPSHFLTFQILYSDQKPHKTVSCFMFPSVFTVQCSHFSHNNNLLMLIALANTYVFCCLHQPYFSQWLQQYAEHSPDIHSTTLAMYSVHHWKKAYQKNLIQAWNL